MAYPLKPSGSNPAAERLTDVSLEDAQMRLAAIIESSQDAIIGKDMDGIIVSWNAAAERLFGYKADEIIGQSALKLVPPERHHEEPEILRKIEAGQKVEH